MMRQILMVCTGNTCRSPMAQGIMQQLLQKNNLSGIVVSSAGIAAFTGSLPSSEAVRVMEERGVDISGVRSRIISPELLGRSDLVLTMTRSQCQQICRIYADCLDKTATISQWAEGIEDDVIDPIGQSIAAYRKAADQIEKYAQIIVRKIKEAG